MRPQVGPKYKLLPHNPLLAGELTVMFKSAAPELSGEKEQSPLKKKTASSNGSGSNTVSGYDQDGIPSRNKPIVSQRSS